MDDWQQQRQLEEERYELSVLALSRCLKAGAKKEDVQWLAKECGIDFKYINGENSAKN